MKKIIVSIAAVIATAIVLNAQNSSSRPTSMPTTGQVKIPTCVPKAKTKASPRPDSYKIETKYQPGLTYEIELQTKTEVSNSSTGNMEEVITNVSYYIQTSPADANGQMKLTIRLARMQNKSPSASGSFDSDNCTNPKMAVFLNILTKYNYQFTLSKDGVLGSIEGIDNAIKESGINKERADFLESGVAGAMSELILLPMEYANGYELAVGEEYESNATPITEFGRPGKGRGEEKLAYKLADVATSDGSKIATIDLSGTATFRGTAFTRSGQIKFNLTKAFVESLKNESIGQVNGETYAKKAEMTVKLVDKIPELKSASRPASQATSQAGK